MAPHARPHSAVFTILRHLVLLALVCRSWTAVYYVDYVGGSDANNGTAMSTPWQHIPDDTRATGVAAAHTPVPGDTFAFKGGVVYDGADHIPFRGSGTSAQRITYEGSQPGWGSGRAVITRSAIDLNGRSYITIHGFEMKDSDGCAITQDMDANLYTGTIIDDNIIHNYNRVWKGAIYINSTQQAVISNNEIYDIDYNANKQRGWGIHLHGRGAGGVFTSHTPGNVVRGNRIYRTGDSHISIFGQRDCTLSGNIMGPDIWSEHAQGITYYYNDGKATIIGNYYKGDRGALTFEGMSTINPVLVANNVFDSQNNVGYVIASWGPGATGAMHVFNNVIIGSSNHHCLGFGSDTYSSIIIQNNIIDGGENEGGHSHNLWINPGASGEVGGVYQTDLSAIFVDTANGDYRLKAGSPAIDRGVDVSAYGVTTDFTGGSRVRGAATDIGPYESGAVSVSSPIITTQPTSISVQAGQAATFIVSASGTPAPTFQWQRNGNAIGGATSASYTTSTTAMADSGATFRCVVSNSAGSVTSTAATLTVTAAPAAAGVGTGLAAVYYQNKDFTNPVAWRIDPTVDFAWGAGSPDARIATNTFSARWRGQVQAQYSQTYTFFVTGDDGVRLSVDGQVLIDRWKDQGATEYSATITLVAGQKYDLVLEYYENLGAAVAKLSWVCPSTPKQIIPTSQLYPAVPPAGSG